MGNKLLIEFLLFSLISMIAIINLEDILIFYHKTLSKIRFSKSINYINPPEDYGITKYKWIDEKLDVYQDVDLTNRGLTKLPFVFNIIHGDFNCSENNLISLEDGPQKVSGNFNCSQNKLTSLKGCPKEIKGSFSCSNNQLVSLEYCPEEITGSFDCYSNNLKSLKGCPKEIKGSFSCSNNQLVSLEHCPEKIDGYFSCFNNNLTSLEYCPQNINGYFDFHLNPIKIIKEFPIIKGKLYSDIEIEEINKMIRIEKNKNSIRSKMKQLNR